MVHKRELTCKRSHPKEFALRPTQAGDICILLEVSQAEDIASLKARQSDLIGIYGGAPVSLIHLTCQRFSALEGHRPDEILATLNREIELARSKLVPIPITAVGLVPLYVPFDQQNVLKWCIEVTEDLRTFVKLIQNILAHVKISSLYQPWFVPTLITVLKDLPSLEEKIDSDHEATRFPQHLFTGRRLQLSRINAPDDYEILATVDW